MSNKKGIGHRAIITGASTGIGREIAHQLAKEGSDLLLISRTQEKLESLKKEILGKEKNLKVHILPLDLSFLDSANKVFDWCREYDFKPTILINNAGAGTCKNFSSLGEEELKEESILNSYTPMQLIKQFIDCQKDEKESFILNVASSIIMTTSTPYFANYSATKSYLRSLGRALSHELRPDGIYLTTVCPGPVKTNFLDRSDAENLKIQEERLGLSAEFVAKKALKAMFSKKREIVPGKINYFSFKLCSLLPSAFLEKLAIRIFNNS